MNTTHPDHKPTLAATRGGRVRATVANFRAIIANDDAFRGRLAWNERERRAYFDGAPVSDRVVDEALRCINAITGPRCSLRRAREALTDVAKTATRSANGGAP